MSIFPASTSRHTQADRERQPKRQKYSKVHAWSIPAIKGGREEVRGTNKRKARDVKKLLIKLLS